MRILSRAVLAASLAGAAWPVALPVLAQPAPARQPVPWVADTGSDPRLRDAVRLGAMATLAPLCGLRDAGWAGELRSAETEAAPTRDLAAGALGYADHEALETFADSAPDAACARVARDPDLARADAVVARHRRAAASGHVS